MVRDFYLLTFKITFRNLEYSVLKLCFQKCLKRIAVFKILRMKMKKFEATFLFCSRAKNSCGKICYGSLFILFIDRLTPFAECKLPIIRNSVHRLLWDPLFTQNILACGFESLKAIYLFSIQAPFKRRDNLLWHWKRFFHSIIITHVNIDPLKYSSPTFTQ